MDQSSVKQKFFSQFTDFLTNSPTSYHAARQGGELLKQAGFTQLDCAQDFSTAGAPNSKFFFIAEGAVFAWVTPAAFDPDTPPVFRVVAAHTDSPAFKLKPQADFFTNPWGQLGVEVYGGPLWNSWLDRDLGLAGRLVDKSGGIHLVKTGPLCRIAQLPPHLDRSVNSEGLHLDAQKHLSPLWTLAPAAGEEQPKVLHYLCQQAGLDYAKLSAFDIFTFDTQGPARLGMNEEFLSSGRLDNLSSAIPGLYALMEGQTKANTIGVLALFDNEEIGSRTSTGADSTQLETLLKRLIMARFGDNYFEAYARALASSVLVSADAGHLYNPNYSEKFDPHTHPAPGGGVLTKYNAQGHYTSNARSVAIWNRALDLAKVRGQNFVSNNSVPCGSTVGPFLSSRLAINSVDVGIGLLAMHSVREMCALNDLWDLKEALRAFFGD